MLFRITFLGCKQTIKEKEPEINVVSFNRSRWRKKSPHRPLFFSISLILLFLFFFIAYTGRPLSVLTIPNKTLKYQFSQCSKETLGEKFLWYAPHSGFSNQLSELKNAILIAAILNRTLIVPPILDHHAIALGSCPKFRVLDPKELQMSVWNHIIELLQGHRYVSIADIVDFASLGPSSMVKTIDFRVFASLWCGLKVDLSCFNILKEGDPLLDNLRKCGSLVSGMDGNIDNCIYALNEDCRTTVWTYQESDENEVLDSFQPDEEFQKKKKIFFVRRRRDVYKALGPGLEVASATVLAFGSLFTAPYKGSQLYIDIHEALRDHRIQNLLRKIEFLQFVPEITSVGKQFVIERIKAPFLCAQLRLLDGQFKNHWKATFLGLKQKVESLRQRGPLPVHIFIMTDLPKANWTGSYLGDLARDSDSYRLCSLQMGNELVQQTVEKIMAAGHGMKSGFRASLGERSAMKNCSPRILPDILLYMEETVCSCASLGFVGTTGSTIAENIQLIRRRGICSSLGLSEL